MDKTNERVKQLEDELNVLKSQLQQKQAQLDLVNSQGKTEKERLQASLNSMLDGTLFHSIRDAHTGALYFDYVSDTWEKIMGVTAEESMADVQKVFENIESDDLKRMMQNIYESTDPKERFNIEVRYNHPISKQQRWIQIATNPFRSGNYIYSDGFIFDITTRKIAELKLDAELKRLEAISNMPAGTLYRTVRDMKTGTLRFEHLYGKWEELSGVSVEDSLANLFNVFKNFEANDLKRLMQAIEESLNPLKSFEIECRYNHPHRKDECWTLISSHPRFEGDQIVADGFIFDISKLKITERKLKAEKERLETLGNHILDGVLFRFEIDKHTKNMSLAYASRSWEKITGIPVDVAMADINSMFEMIHPDDAPAVMQEIDKCVQTLTTLQCVYRVVENGQTRWLQMTSHPRNEDGLIVADGIINDITSHKEIEYELKAEKNRLQSIGDNIPGGALFQFVLDNQTDEMRFTYTSATWDDVTGISADLAKNNILNIFDALYPDDLPILIQSIEDSARTMNDINIEILANGGCWLHIVARPRCEGTCIVWDGIITNITDRKKIEHELKAEKNRLQTIGDNIPGGTLFQLVLNTITGQIHFSYTSATWNDVTGIPEDIPTTNNPGIFDVLNPNDLSVIFKAIDDSARTMNDIIMELFADGCRWLHIMAHPRREETTIVWDGIITNISAQKEAEAELTRYRQNLEQIVQERTDELATTNEELTAVNEELANTNEELMKYQTELEKMVDDRTQELLHAKEKAEESDRLKSAFLANMSHEIRTPLYGIVGILQLFDSDNLSPACRREYIDIIKNSSAQLTDIIEDIIDVSKIEAKQMNINAVPIRLNELMNEMRVFFETYLHTKDKGHIEMILDNSRFIDDCLIYIDATRFRQVIINLIGNAVKFTDTGYIRFGYCQSAPDMLEFMVEDSGIGLHESQKDVIFERFRQAEFGNTRPYGGTGLGLTISRNLVQMMGGNMWVKSTEGVGSKFYFTVSYLPVAPEDEHIFTEISAEKTLLDKPFDGKMILLVEPVPLKFKYYEKLISATGATVIKADSLEECSARLEQFEYFDIVLLFDNEDSDQIRHIINVCASSPVALVVSGKKQLSSQNMCNTTIELPVDYAKILKVLEEYAR